MNHEYAEELRRKEDAMVLLRGEVSRRDEQVRNAYGELRELRGKVEQYERIITAQLGPGWIA